MDQGKRQGSEEREFQREKTEQEDPCEVDRDFIENRSDDDGCEERVFGFRNPPKGGTCQGGEARPRDLENRPGPLQAPHEEVRKVERPHPGREGVFVAEEKPYSYRERDDGFHARQPLKSEPPENPYPREKRELERDRQQILLPELLKG